MACRDCPLPQTCSDTPAGLEHSRSIPDAHTGVLFPDAQLEFCLQISFEHALAEGMDQSFEHAYVVAAEQLNFWHAKEERHHVSLRHRAQHKIGTAAK